MCLTPCAVFYTMCCSLAPCAVLLHHVLFSCTMCCSPHHICILSVTYPVNTHPPPPSPHTQGTIVEVEGIKNRRYWTFGVVDRSGLSLIRLSSENQAEANKWIDALVKAGCERRVLSADAKERSPLRSADVRWVCCKWGVGTCGGLCGGVRCVCGGWVRWVCGGLVHLFVVQEHNQHQ